MEETLIIKLEKARGELLNVLQNIQERYNFPAYILDNVLTQILNDIKSQEKIEIINEYNYLVQKIKTEQHKEGQVNE